MTTTITEWSPARLDDYEKCPQKAKLKHLDKIKVPTPPPLQRGTDIHLEAERFVKGELALSPTLENHVEPFTELRELYDAGHVILEQPWGLTQRWQPTGFFESDTHGRIKLDALAFPNGLDGDFARVIDYKTGKKSGNEIKHATTGKIYALSAALYYPNLTHIQVEFWYLDLPKHNLTTVKYSRQRALEYQLKLEGRIHAMTSDTQFRAKPSAWNCKYCEYNSNGTGDCLFTEY